MRWIRKRIRSSRQLRTSSCVLHVTGGRDQYRLSGILEVKNCRKEVQ